MKQALVDYYQRELNYLKRRGELFAQEYPKIGARLHITDDQSRDPHVERVIQGIAFLNARIRKKLDDEFPELCQTLLEVIYPHYLRPLPSYSIVSFLPEKGLSTVTRIEKGRIVESDGDEAYSCRFSTVYDTDVLPLSVKVAKLQSCPVEAPNPGNLTEIESVLKIRLETVNSDVELEKLGLSKVRFYLKGNRHYSFSLYELILNHTTKVAIANGAHDPNAAFLIANKALAAVGFSEEEGMLPYPDQSFTGYRLLTEYFAYPEKFLFFDLLLDDNAAINLQGSHVELYFYFDKSLPDIETTINKDHFILNATPLINLYEQYSEPTRLEMLSYEYPVVADARSPDCVEVYSLESVSLAADESRIESVSPFFGISNSQRSELTDLRWHMRREELEYGNTRSQVYITLINLDHLLEKQTDPVLLTRLRCFNGTLPYRLSKQQRQPSLILSNGSSAVDTILLEKPFSDVIRPNLDDDNYWQLLSHLNLNYTSLTAGPKGTNAFKKILSLYDFTLSGENESVINAFEINSVESSTARIVDRSGMPFFCRGSKVMFTLDETRFAGSSPYLFASVIERFLGLYTHINSFVQLSVKLSGSHKTLKQWPPRAGEQTLL